MNAPVFYDPSGRRRRWSLRSLVLAVLLLTALGGVFAFTIIDVPVPRPLAFGVERPHPRPLVQQVGHIRHKVSTRLHALFGRWLPLAPTGAAAAGGRPAHQAVIGFYTPWDDASRSSLTAHVAELDWLVPAMMSVTGPDHHLTTTDDPHLNAILDGAAHRPAILPMVQNVADAGWDGAGTAKLLHDPAARTRFLDQLEPLLAAHNARGVVFDLESLPASAQPDYKLFLKQAHARFAPRGWLVTLAVPVADSDWRLADYAKVADRLFIMAYDQHWPGSTPGPIAGQPWFAQATRAAVAQIGAAKSIVAIGSYAYDWTEHGGEATALSIEDTWLAAHDSGVVPRFDAASGNATFDYEESGKAHHVWMLDAASAWNELRVAHDQGVAGVALWRLGLEDPGIWPVFRGFHSGTLPDLTRIHASTSVDVEGTGELLRIDHVPTPGRRTMTVDGQGLIRNEVYHRLPTPYTVERTGHRPGLVALTFDDGPDPTWTPAILKILEARHVPGAFFVIGENAVTHPALLNDIIAAGSEIGNHSYTHPNLALESARGTRLELNATQRLIEAYTGHATRLFRAPYFGDAEPTTRDELDPVLAAQQDGYLNVGLHVDPNDWQRPGADAIVNQVVTQVGNDSAEQSAQVILLHDGGGDRAQTVAALPRIIDTLRARGYRFVPVSELAGLSASQVMPTVAGRDLAWVRVDVAVFLLVGGLAYAIRWLFFVAIVLGLGRAITLAVLAIIARRRERGIVPPAIDPARFVSVLIPAFNEARVIEASVRRVLASRDVALEVIVIDDGSTDGTSQVVAGAFADEPRVRLLTLANGGKAAALNTALRLARGDVVVALDADTQFEPLTIARLARWFVDPTLGAVAGNAQVGNRVNLVTRWQAIEYTTAQSLERRALAGFDAITVVPGAVGAWSRAALDAVGGYPVDTLAEDQDLTIAVQRAGWRVACDPEAVAWTEAPESFAALSRQRFRWAFGTLQCLWKHRAILRTGKPRGLATIGLPQAWLFQIAFSVVSPIIDLALVISILGTMLHVHQHGWAQTQSDVLRMAAFWVAFTTVDVVCGWIAYRLDGNRSRYPAGLLVGQRLIYRQLMYIVVLRAVAAALTGPWVGWGRMERSGRVLQPAT
ncbi:glycosyltransferase [Sphingomonas prati]|uniref:Chitooligosaccharide deacetylase n=1 Tax=Sphingomonas prati TaxID=1843237 RepID=A0A7W9BQL5_9SPHN|nr:glycosyltransferase [Sphingomonas prati]MBB5728154.1 cellulose synthase/poly-beta-1,6-N-acetylglucosamine synthase-like glycosyltransferase/peptidoglycan/xylan/chitin deacetylase (PgdA/CDA1 family)/spore germination protein YaaH [Sphingomonas prati]GGE83674.1 glycosyl transferase family 2 [Sphingomonas prati]